MAKFGPKPEAILDRLLNNIVIDSNGCWIWQGKPTPQGYGRIVVGSRATQRRWSQVHRVSYATFVEPVQDELVIDHLCRVKLCINPAHLDPVTDAVNVLRGIGPSSINAQKTECVRGHPFDKANTRYRSNGQRQCRACDAALARWVRERVRRIGI